MKGLYRYSEFFGRMGDLEGLFIAKKADVKAFDGSLAYFGEVLGKHSEIEGLVSDETVNLISDDKDVIKVLVLAFGGNNISGYNPIERLIEMEEEEEDNRD